MAKIYTIPNIITFIRIFLIPIILYLLFSENPNIVLIAGFLFIVSSVSDYFDGYLARTLNQSSKLGTLLDPIADKLLIASVIVVLVDTGVISNIHVVPAMISLSILIISLGFELNDFLWNIGLITLWIAAIITLLSGYNYMVKGLKHI